MPQAEPHRRIFRAVQIDPLPPSAQRRQFGIHPERIELNRPFLHRCADRSGQRIIDPPRFCLWRPPDAGDGIAIARILITWASFPD